MQKDLFYLVPKMSDQAILLILMKQAKCKCDNIALKPQFILINRLFKIIGRKKMPPLFW